LLWVVEDSWINEVLQEVDTPEGIRPVVVITCYHDDELIAEDRQPPPEERPLIIKVYRLTTLEACHFGDNPIVDTVTMEDGIHPWGVSYHLCIKARLSVVGVWAAKVQITQERKAVRFGRELNLMVWRDDGLALEATPYIIDAPNPLGDMLGICNGLILGVEAHPAPNPCIIVCLYAPSVAMAVDFHDFPFRVWGG
jgi:hypothetical protein